MDCIEELDRAAAALKRQGSTTAEEKRYALAYQQCVQAGLKPQLKRKYR
jgi:hypothetical protein